MTASDGLLVVDKPAGWTSHDVVARCRRLCGTRRVGHAGTLDPMATGVLVLGIGRATRLLGRLALADKAYDATIRLGQSTVTDDAEGDIVASSDASDLDASVIAAAVLPLTGSVDQRPSAVSAIKVGGQRAYKRVRAGEEVTLEPRRVTVARFDVLDVRRAAGVADVDVVVECSTGTYVRALARDLGAALGVGGHLTRLRRTRVGPYDLARAVTLESLEVETEHERVPVVSLAAAAADSFATYRVSGDDEAAVRHGRALPVHLGTDGQVALFGDSGEFLALYEQHGPLARAVAVFV